MQLLLTAVRLPTIWDASNYKTPHKSVCLKIDEIWYQQAETNSLIKSEGLRDCWRGKLLPNVLFIGLSMNHLQPFPTAPVVHSHIYSTLTLNKCRMVTGLTRKTNPSKRSCWYKPRLFPIYGQRSLWSSVHTFPPSYRHREQLSFNFLVEMSLLTNSKPTLAEESLSHQKQGEFFLHSKEVQE